MTLLSYVETLGANRKPVAQLFVCGTPSKEWMDWLTTTDVPLTASQQAWKHALACDTASSDDVDLSDEGTG